MEKNKNEKVLTSFVMPANLWPLIRALPTARSQWLALMAINAYGYEGIETDTEDASANAVLASAIIQIDAMRGREQRPERGAKDAPTKGGRRGNPNFTKGRTNPYYRDNSRSQLSLFNELKHNKLNKDNSKIIQGDNNLSINELYKDNSEIIRDNSGDNSTPFNELKHSELDNDNSTIRKKEKKEESLDNTSPSTELVLSKRKEKEKEKESEPALAPLNGGAVSNSFSNSFSETRFEKIGDGKATPAPCNGGASLPTGVNEKNWSEGETIPQTSSANSHSLQTPPTPTPPATPQRTVGFAGNVPMSEDERAKMDAEVNANIKAQRDAERDAIEKGEPLPPAAKGIRAVIDDSEEARRERDSKRIHDLKQLIEMAENEEERKAIRAYL